MFAPKHGCVLAKRLQKSFDGSERRRQRFLSIAAMPRSAFASSFIRERSCGSAYPNCTKILTLTTLKNLRQKGRIAKERLHVG
jgi:hypothetical protein